MTQDILRYDLMVQDALKGVVRKILVEAGRDGLPGEHHFYITFRTTAPGVRLSQRLREKHPEEMTVVLQHQFWDLNVNDHAFEVGLSFGGVPERLLVPFDSITTFFDPSVQFGLKFEAQDTAEDAGTNVTEQGNAKMPRGAASEPTLVPPASAAPLALPARIAPVAAPVARSKTVDKSAGTDGKKPGKVTPATGEDDGASAQVVSLDAFRKKP